MLSPAQIAARANKVTASFLPKLMAGDDAAILNEWRRIVDDPAYELEDLSGSWPVAFGSFIEPLALDWHQRKTGNALTRRGENVTHPERPHVCCTLDAWRAADNAVVDVKAIGQWRKLDEALPYYAPQMACQRSCVGAARASLLVVHGGSEPVEHPIDIPADYEAEMWERVDAFWRCVETLTPPVAMAPVAAPVPPEQYRSIDLDALHSEGAELPNWGMPMYLELKDWLRTAAAAKENASAAKAVKDMLPDDVGFVNCGGAAVKRAKNGAVSIKEAKA